MRPLYLLLLCLCMHFCTFAQANTPNVKASVKAAAQKMNDALVKKDYKTFVKNTYPKAVSMTEGGEEKLISELASQIKTMEQEGTTIIKVWPGEVAGSVIDTAGEFQCIIPQKMIMKLPDGMLTTETNLIALSSDKGKRWYFIDIADKDLNALREVFPNISSRLKVGKSPEPVFVPNEGTK